jgi:DNA-binding MarR family transcriptional regulator
MSKRQHAVKQEERPPRTPAGDAFSKLAILVLRLAGVLTAAGDTLAKPAGQTSARWQVLAMLENGPATVAHIARMLGLARQSVQRVADLLEQDELASYEENPDHARAKLLTLTGRGRSALVMIQKSQAVWADALGERLGEAPLQRATQVLERVLAALTEENVPAD